MEKSQRLQLGEKSKMQNSVYAVLSFFKKEMEERKFVLACICIKKTLEEYTRKW